MKTSVAGRAAIVNREGRKLVAYRDTQGILTIGCGHTGRMSPPAVTPGMTITEAQCDAFLASDLAPVEAVINSAVHVPISQNEFDAMASLGFNIGAAGLKGSTIVKKLNLGDVQGAADAFMNWSKPAVLIGRRRDEAAQFRKPDPQVTADRAQVLTTKAMAKKAQATNASVGAGSLVGGGAAIAVAAPHAHHWGAVLAIGCLLIVGAFIAALVAAARHASAATLATHASDQASLAASLSPVESLKL